MAEQRVIIEHPDGRRYSVTEAGFEDLGYKAEGFAIVGPDGDVAGTPARAAAARRAAKSRRAVSRGKPAAAPAETKADEPA